MIFLEALNVRTDDLLNEEYEFKMEARNVRTKDILNEEYEFKKLTV